MAFQVRRPILGLNPDQAVETTKLEYGGGKKDFSWSGKMRRDGKDGESTLLDGH